MSRLDDSRTSTFEYESDSVRFAVLAVLLIGVVIAHSVFALKDALTPFPEQEQSDDR